MPSLFEAYGLTDVPGAAPQPEPEKRGAVGVAKDVGISLLKGAIGVPEAAVGLADLVTAGQAGKAAEAAGFRPKEAKAILDEGYSQEQKDAFARVQAAQGFGDTLLEAARNPSVVAHSVLESLPSMGAGGVVARGGMALAPRLAPMVAGALGEGAVGAGQAAEQIRQETPGGTLTGKQVLLAAGSGALDTGFSLLGGKIAKSLGIHDVDTMLAGASRDPVAAKGLTRRVLEGAVSEGILEELPQSVQEQVLQNAALGKPLDEGVNQAAVLGMLSGAAMGGGANVFSGTPAVAPAPAPLPEPAGPLSRAAGAAPQPVAAAVGIEPAAAAPGAAVPAAQEPVVDPVMERIKTLQGADRTEALAAYNIVNRDDSPKGVRQYNSKLLDQLLAKLEPAEPEPSKVESSDPSALLASTMGQDPVQQALAQRRNEEAALQNLENWMARAQPLPLEKAQGLQATAAERGLAMEVVPHGAGQGFTVVPAEWITPEMRGQVATALPLDTAPTGVLRADAAGKVVPETGAAAINTKNAAAAVAAEAKRKADLGLTPDIEAVQAGKKREPLPTVQPGDIRLKSGEPFKNKGAAVRAQAKAGAGAGEVTQVQGGWVVRTAGPVQQELEGTNVGSGDATVAVAPADGGRGSDDAGSGRGNPAAAGGDAGGRVVHAAAAPAAAGTASEPVRNSSAEPIAAVASAPAAAAPAAQVTANSSAAAASATQQVQKPARRPEAEVRADLDQLTAAAEARLEQARKDSPNPVSGAAIDHMTPEELQRRHELLQELPLAGEERAAAKKRVAAKTSKRRADAAMKKTDIPFRRADGTNAGVSLKERADGVQQFVDGITKNWANAPKIVVVENLQDPRVPEKVRETDAAQQQQGSEGQVHGFHYQGTVYLVADALAGTDDALTTLAHEALGHAGLQGFFGEALKPIKQQIVAMRKKEVLGKAAAYGMPVTPEAVRKELGAGATEADVQKVINMRLMYAAEEVLAEMAQTTPQLGFVKRAIAAIRTFLRDVLGVKLELSDDEIVNSFILPARGWVVRGEGTGAQQAAAPAPAPAAQFSRGEAGNTLATARPVREQIMQAMNDTFTAPGKLNWWHKTVGTQYNLAQRSPQFKRVFDAVQDFLNDVSLYATEAADLAPKILPKLETWRDIGKSPISAQDNKAVSAPIFEGTLLWARDERGRPVKLEELRTQAEGLSAEAKAQRMLRAGAISENVLKMWKGLPIEQYEAAVATRFDSQMLRAGVVWSDDELRSQFKLTDAQVGLYREARAAIDRSLTNMAISDMVRFAGRDAAEVRQEALDVGDVDAAALILRDHLLELSEKTPDRNEVLIDTAERVIEKADRARDLMDRGYAPLSRFGHYTVDAMDESGERVYFGMFETARDAAVMARKMQNNFPTAKVVRGTVSDEEYRLFAGVSPETVELFGEMLGLESQGDAAKDQAFQAYLKVGKANRSAMKRLIERKGIAGFNEDVGRVLAGFVYSNARQTSQNLHMGEMTDAAAAISDPEQGGGKQLGELKDQAVRLVEYVKNPQEEAQGFRGLLFAQYLGGSVASALVNMLQPVQVTLPYLSQFGGAAKAAARMAKAVADVRKKITGDAALDAALKKAEEEGIVAPQEVHQLMAQASGRGVLKSGDGTKAGAVRAGASNALSRLSLAWGKVFGMAEMLNRRVTFIAAYRTAVQEGIADPAAFAEKAIAETQFIYNKANKPNWARGAIGSTLFTFKQYSISYVELLHRMATQGGPEGKKAALLALGMLFLFGGAGGLPFAEDAEDLVDGVMQRLGYNFSTKLAKKQFFENLLGKELGRFAEHGLSGLPGVPIDVSGRLGMGNLIPGTGLLVDKEDHTRDVTELAGAAGDFATRLATGTNKMLRGDATGAVKDVAPRAAANAMKAAEMYTTGVYKDSNGKKVLDVDGYDALAKAIGFQPTSVANEQQRTGLEQQLKANHVLAEKALADQWAKAVADGDQEALASARDALRAYNMKNPDLPIVISRSQIVARVKTLRMSKEERVLKSTPKEIRNAVREQLAPA